ncbi:hypothetical protein Lalb_Chr15g0082021 [Lupinus albus]|uniref:Uncharacterized protein n=1 Tax=Lupinus albus TaxID=3870 RepID=A0A6A4P965_LUPAL|nr:hypothetical protein Lalb_Chr15g0082021 [Lupinus albus]
MDVLGVSFIDKKIYITISVYTMKKRTILFGVLGEDVEMIVSFNISHYLQGSHILNDTTFIVKGNGATMRGNEFMYRNQIVIEFRNVKHISE